MRFDRDDPQTWPFFSPENPNLFHCHGSPCSTASTVCSINVAIVIGPIPPGTGVYAEHLSMAADNIDISDPSGVIARVHRYSARFDPRALDEFRFPDGAYDNVGEPNKIWKTVCSGLTDRDGRMCVEQHHRDGFAQYRAAPDDDRVLAFNRNVVMSEQPHDACGRCRAVCALAHRHAAETERGDAIDILRDCYLVEALSLVDLRRDGMLEQDSSNPGISIEFIDLGQHLFRCCRLWEHNPERFPVRSRPAGVTFHLHIQVADDGSSPILRMVARIGAAPFARSMARTRTASFAFWSA